ncbi:hypothetical protein A8F94_18190 [Bacillus sp. FJAT-27225]|nr:hypothetical protein A8F94_18190 [Bacillus sp. FJAT-27225]
MLDEGFRGQFGWPRMVKCPPNGFSWTIRLAENGEMSTKQVFVDNLGVRDRGNVHETIFE